MKSIKTLVILIAALLLTACNSSRENPPNIVFILADDMGYSDLGCYGAEFLNTPNIDELAENGLRFTNFYNTGRCWPTRTSLLSGYYPHQVLSDPVEGVDYSEGTFKPVNKTWLPALLKNQGYRCYHSGKWHLVRKVPKHSEVSMVEAGFDHSFKTQDGRHLRPTKLMENEKAIQLPGPEDGYEASSAIVDYGIKYLNEHAKDYPETPFFTYLAFITPHFPLQALQEDIDAYLEVYTPGWSEVRALRTENRKQLGFSNHDVNAFEPERFAPWNLTQEELIEQIDPNDIAHALPWDSLNPDQQEFQSLKMAIHAAMITPWTD